MKMNKAYNVKNISKKQDKDLYKFILDTDSRYRGQLFTLADKILKSGNVQIILLCGPSCAGKTTTANLLKSILELKCRTVDVISMDNFFIDLDKRKPLPNGKQDFDSPDILNYDLMKQCFKDYFAGKDVYFPEYDFKVGKSIPNSNFYKYKPKSIIIFEGIHVLNPRLIEALGDANYFRIYVSPIESFKTDSNTISTRDLRLLRRIVRDIARRNTPASKTIEMWPSVLKVEDEHITPFRSKADYYIDTTHEYELGVYKSELDKFMSQGKIEEKDIPFKDLLQYIDPISKNSIPNTSLMWEFVNKD